MKLHLSVGIPAFFGRLCTLNDMKARFIDIHLYISHYSQEIRPVCFFHFLAFQGLEITPGIDTAPAFRLEILRQ